MATKRARVERTRKKLPVRSTGLALPSDHSSEKNNVTVTKEAPADFHSTMSDRYSIPYTMMFHHSCFAWL